MKIGKVSEIVFTRSILKYIKTKRTEVISGAGVGEDCAIFTLSKEEGLATCVQEGSIRETGSLSQVMEKCVNNLVASGAEPIAVMLTYILPPSVEEPDIKRWMQEAQEVCAHRNMEIAGGHTTVTHNVNIPIAVVTGYGKTGSGEVERTGKAVPGQSIIVSKWIGLEGTAKIAKEHKEILCTRYPRHLVEEAADFGRYLSIVPEASLASGSGAWALHDASTGGIFAALWELAERSGVGLTVDLKKLPIRQETIEICEFYNINPYELMSGGSLVMTSDHGEALIEVLQKANIPATIVGQITEGKDKIIINEEERRYLDRPRSDEIYKLEKQSEDM